MSTNCRRSRDSDIWHICSNCSKWPILNYKERRSLPYGAKLCNECKKIRTQEGVVSKDFSV